MQRQRIALPQMSRSTTDLISFSYFRFYAASD
jgi:hypothetical protein